MPFTEDEPVVGLPFTLNDYYRDWGEVRTVNELIEDGKLPFDTFFRLASVGYMADHATGDSSTYLNYNLMLDMVRHIDAPDSMRAETQEILYGELPNAIVDVNSRSNYPAYTRLDPLYYRMRDLVRAVKQRRLETGQTLPDDSFDGRLHVRDQDEWSRCKGIARPLWKLMVKRFHPKWLETPSDYFRSYHISFNTVYYIGKAAMRYGVVSHAVFSDPLVLSIYNEAITTGVRGIGPKGKEDLRLLLSEEHPELLEGHEVVI